MAFLISTPESGVDSIAITYALIDPIMTLARPVVAFITATAAGIAENLLIPGGREEPLCPDLSCPVDGCCDGVNCPPEEHSAHHSLTEKLRAGVKFSFGELWGDLAVWLLVGLLLAGLISTLIPAGFLNIHLCGGLPAMLIMLAAGIPLYISEVIPHSAQICGALMLLILSIRPIYRASISMLPKKYSKKPSLECDCSHNAR